MMESDAAEQSLATRTPAAGPAEADIHLERVTKRFGETLAVDGLDLSIERGAFFALLGPSGCGKTTTLRMIGGFEDPTEGRVFLGGDDVTERPPYKRDVNTVFQSYALFPHLTRREERRLRPRAPKVWPRPRSARASARRSSSSSSASWASASPAQLSGGQQQRVALARALVNRPRALLLDEPLGALDLRLRKQLQIELKRIQQDVGITFVHVTHDQEEAMTHGRHDRGDERRPDRAGRRRRRALRAPADRVRRQLPRRLQPRSTAGSAPPTAALRAVETHDGAELHVPAERVGPHDGDDVRIGVRPEKITLLPAGADAARRRQRPARHGHRRRRSSASRSSTSSGPPAARSSPSFAQNTDGAEPESLGVGREVQLAWNPHHTFVVAKERRMNDPTLRARPRRPAAGERLSRRRFARPRGQRRAAPVRARALLRRAAASRAPRRGRRPAAAAADVNHPKAPIGDWTFSNWPLYIDKKVLKSFDKRYGGHVKYVEDINDNFEFFGKVRQQLQAGQPIGRDIVTLTDYMAARWVRDGYVEPIDKTQRARTSQNLVDNLATINYDPKREYTLPWQSGAIGHRLQHQEDRARAEERQGPLRPEVQGQVTMLSEPYDSA